MKPRDTEYGLTQAALKAVVKYDRRTGVFVWKKSNNQHRCGSVAGNREAKTGYIRIKIDGHKYMASRLAWLYVYGCWPANRVDHKNLDRSDNRIRNLRLATNSQNGANRNASSNNMLGIKGVRLHECGKYVARINHNGKSFYLGLFESSAEAAAAYKEKAEQFFGQYARAA